MPAVILSVIVLFCASGTGIYGSIVSGMTGDHSILLAKSILDLPTALIFACALGGVLLLATGFRMIKVKEFSIADMIPAMLIVMPVSHLWVTYVLPVVAG